MAEGVVPYRPVLLLGVGSGAILGVPAWILSLQLPNDFVSKFPFCLKQSGSCYLYYYSSLMKDSLGGKSWLCKELFYVLSSDFVLLRGKF